MLLLAEAPEVLPEVLPDPLLDAAAAAGSFVPDFAAAAPSEALVDERLSVR